MIEAKYFLNDNDSALGRPRWIGTKSVELVVVAGKSIRDAFP